MPTSNGEKSFPHILMMEHFVHVHMVQTAFKIVTIMINIMVMLSK